MTSANPEQSRYIIGSASEQYVTQEVYQQRVNTLQELNKSLLESNRNYLAHLTKANERIAEDNQKNRSQQEALRVLGREKNRLLADSEEAIKLIAQRDNTIESYNRNSCENAMIHKRLKESHNNQTEKMQRLLVNHDTLLTKHALLNRQISALNHMGATQKKISMGIAKVLMFILTQQTNLRNRFAG